MKSIYTILVLAITFSLFSCGSSSEASPEQVDENGAIVGDYLLYKTEAVIGGKTVSEEEASTVWQFTNDSVFVHNPCYLEARKKKEGYQFKDVWYEIDEEITYEGDKFHMAITSYEPTNMTMVFYFKTIQLNQDQKDFRKKKVDWSCLLGEKWVNNQNVSIDRNVIADDQLGFIPIDTLDFSEENSYNYRFSADTLFYTSDSTEHFFTMTFLHRFGDMRLSPKSQCNCDDQFLGYIKL
ncbi:MAG: hypothetical protein ABJG68_00795 [Crocinitomicaceae bacterium]